MLAEAFESAELRYVVAVVLWLVGAAAVVVRKVVG
jgi:hypothetical protein